MGGTMYGVSYLRRGVNPKWKCYRDNDVGERRLVHWNWAQSKLNVLYESLAETYIIRSTTRGKLREWQIVFLRKCGNFARVRYMDKKKYGEREHLFFFFPSSISFVGSKGVEHGRVILIFRGVGTELRVCSLVRDVDISDAKWKHVCWSPEVHLKSVGLINGRMQTKGICLS